jgi:hypothetical protein
VAAVQTCRGSHTHTLVPDPHDPANLYVYGSGTSSVRPGEELAGCSEADPKDDPNTALFSIDVIKVPLAAPEKAAVVNRPRIFADPKTGAIAGLEKGGGTRPRCRATDPLNRGADAIFDRGPIDAKQLITGGFWSAYWYNGRIYGSEIARGIDVFKLTPSEYLTQNEIDAASVVRADEVNPQEQTRIVWPASSVVARAYIDQLTRGKAIQPERARAVNAALDRADRLRTAQDEDASAVAAQLDGLATQVARDASAASGRDAARLESLAATIKGRAAKLR